MSSIVFRCCLPIALAGALAQVPLGQASPTTSVSLPLLVPGFQTEADATGCGPDEKHKIIEHADEHPTPHPPQGKAIIYVVRPHRGFPLHKAPIRLSVNGKWVGTSPDNTYFFFEMEPGFLRLCSKPPRLGGNRQFLGLTVEAGKAYYVMQLWSTEASERLVQLTEAEGEKYVSQARFITFE